MNTGIEGLKIDQKSKELMAKWQKQAETIKEEHPDWDEAQVEEEMKQFIISDAEQVFSSKDSAAYIEEMKVLVQKAEEARDQAIESIMIYMGKTSPTAVATALFELDCGCIRACAVSESGAPMGEMIMVTGKQVEQDYECGFCKDDGGGNPERCINKAIVWPGEESDLPSDEFRLEIGRKVFGDEYTLDDI